MSTTVPLIPGTFYHIYNRGINGENLFIEDRNYRYFLEQVTRYLLPVAEMYAYCLLRNHFHLLVRIRSETEQRALFAVHPVSPANPVFKALSPSRQFANLFNAYAKAINQAYNRHGNLFERPFKRVPVASAPHFVNLVAYIHRNPQHHGFVEDFRDWPHSSYKTMLSNSFTRIPRETVLNWFGGADGFVELHRRNSDDLSEEMKLE